MRCWKYDRKAGELNENVAEEELEFAVQPVPHHERGDSRLKDGMRDPERVIEKSNFLAHVFSVKGAA